MMPRSFSFRGSVGDDGVESLMYRRSQLSIKCIFDYDIMEFATRIRYKRSFCYVSVTVDMCVCKSLEAGPCDANE